MTAAGRKRTAILPALSSEVPGYNLIYNENGVEIVGTEVVRIEDFQLQREDVDIADAEQKVCEECGAAVPDNAPGVMAPYHEKHCSCYAQIE